MSWDYDGPFEECPKCGDCGNWHWTGICGKHPGSPRPGNLPPKPPSKSTQSASKGTDTGEK